MGYRTIITLFHYFQFRTDKLISAFNKIQLIPIRYQVSMLPYILAIEPSCRRDTFKMLLKDFSDEYSFLILKYTFDFYCPYDF